MPFGLLCKARHRFIIVVYWKDVRQVEPVLVADVRAPWSVWVMASLSCVPCRLTQPKSLVGLNQARQGCLNQPSVTNTQKSGSGLKCGLKEHLNKMGPYLISSRQNMNKKPFWQLAALLNMK